MPVVGMLLTEGDRFVGIDVDDCIDDDSPNADGSGLISWKPSTVMSSCHHQARVLRIIAKRGKRDPLDLEW